MKQAQLLAFYNLKEQTNAEMMQANMSAKIVNIIFNVHEHLLGSDLYN